MRLIIDLEVKDLDRAVVFYTEKLGLSLRIKAESWAAIKIGDSEIHLYTEGGANGDIEFYVEDISQEVKKFRDKGIVFHDASNKPRAISMDSDFIVTFPWGRAAFFKDSEGNELAFVQDNSLDL